MLVIIIKKNYKLLSFELRNHRLFHAILVSYNRFYDLFKK
jgi:hypothetical protein